MLKNKLKIAITGNIGSGKSAFSKMIEERGFKVLKADDISKEILTTNPEVKKKIIEEFGQESFIEKEINRKYLAEKVFSNPLNVQVINSILHPFVIEKIHSLIKDELRLKDKVFVEAALIYEADMEEMFDFVILISANQDIRYLRKSETMSKEDFEKRNNNQISEEEKKKRADFIFENNGRLEELINKADLLLTLL
jgi:dephospho-CoA kinase